MLDEEEEDKPETLDEIKKKMKDLFSKLDTLTHYNYTPQAAHADVKIIRNLPTISMEEVAPVAMNDANLLAPQEISDKKKGEYLNFFTTYILFIIFFIQALDCVLNLIFQITVLRLNYLVQHEKQYYSPLI